LATISDISYGIWFALHVLDRALDTFALITLPRHRFPFAISLPQSPWLRALATQDLLCLKQPFDSSTTALAILLVIPLHSRHNDPIMSYHIPGPEASSRGRGRGRGFPPQHNHGRRALALRSGHGVYPICADDDAAVTFVEFVHNQGSQILQATGGPWAPHLYASLIDSTRDHISSTHGHHERSISPAQPVQPVWNGEALLPWLYYPLLARTLLYGL
jgi:hypothetical protein